MTKLVTFPDHDRDLPTPADLDRLMQCRYAVLIVCGRSGSGLLHALLDGHRQVAHIRAIWKFHDFLSAQSGICRAGPGEFVRAFTDYPAHAMLFDTRHSVAVDGQLGETGDVAILINRGAFENALFSALGDHVGSPRRALYACVLAYEWCLGRDLGEARLVLHHLHHGEWLWPDLLVDPFNLAGLKPPGELRAALKPDLLLIPLRSPRAVLRSYPAIAAGVVPAGPDQVTFYETLMRLLPQDWLRARVAAGSDIATMSPRLEDMKVDQSGTLHALCDWLGIDHRDPALARPTYYGQVWTEDGWSVARKRVVEANPDIDRDLDWQDELFAIGSLGRLAADVYPGEAIEADYAQLLQRLIAAAVEPPPTLYPQQHVTPQAKPQAMLHALQRATYMNRFWTMADAQALGSLRLCRPSSLSLTG